MNIHNKKTNVSYICIVAAILIIMNIIGSSWSYRWDFTKNKIYTLSDSSKSVLDKIDDRLAITVYWSDNPPGDLGNTRLYLQDLLEEYAAYSDKYIHFEYFSTDDDEKMQEDAQKSGIGPKAVQDIQSDQITVKNIYMGMVFRYQNKTELIPFVETRKSLEYDITTTIKNLIEINKKTIAIALTGSQKNIKNEYITQSLRQHYTVRNINLDQKISEDIILILLNGLVDSLSVDEKQNLEDFINEGGNLLLSQNRIKTNLSTQQASPIESDIFTLLESYSIKIASNLVMDQNCGKVNVQQKLGFFRIPVPMNYPFLPIIKKDGFNNDVVMVNGLERLRLMFPSELVINDSIFEADNVNIIPLFTSSDQSTSMEEFFNLSPHPDNNPAFRQLNETGKVLGALVEKTNTESGVVNQMVIIADSKFMADDGGGGSEENHIFILNAVDYLLGDKELITLRSRDITSRPLKNLEDDEKSRWKWINILLPSILVVGFGFIRFKRENSRGKMLEEIYD